MSSTLAAPRSRSGWVLRETQIPPPVAVELLRRHPDVLRALAANWVLDRSVFADVSLRGRSASLAELLVGKVSESEAAGWIATSDRRKGVASLFLIAWTMGSDLQREFLRTRAALLRNYDRNNAFAQNMFDQDIMYEYLVNRTWRMSSRRIDLWLAHNPFVVDDDTFVTWAVEGLLPSGASSGWVSDPPSWVLETVLALAARPHLVGDMLDRAGPGAVVVATEVDAPGNVDQILDMLESERGSYTRLHPRGYIRALHRLVCHPGLDTDLRADLCDRLSEQETEFLATDPDYATHDRTGFRYAADARLALAAVPSGNPADYASDELRSAAEFYLGLSNRTGEVPAGTTFEVVSARDPGLSPVDPDVDLVPVPAGSSDTPPRIGKSFENVNGGHPMVVPVDVLEGLAAAAVRHRETNPDVGPTLHQMLRSGRMNHKMAHSHRLLDLSRMLSERFSVENLFDDVSCGTHREGHVPSPGSVLQRAASESREAGSVSPLPVSANWQDMGSYQLSDALHRYGSSSSDNHMLQNSTGNVGRYLAARLGSTVDDVDKWEVFLQLVDVLNESVLLSEAVDMAVALHS